MEITPRFKSSYSGVDMSGESAMDIFMDRVNPMNKQAHPALPNVIKELDVIRKQRGSVCENLRPAVGRQWQKLLEYFILESWIQNKTKTIKSN